MEKSGGDARSQAPRDMNWSFFFNIATRSSPRSALEQARAALASMAGGVEQVPRVSSDKASLRCIIRGDAGACPAARTSRRRVMVWMLRLEGEWKRATLTR